MRLMNQIVAVVVLPAFLAASPAFAQSQRIVTPATMSQALTAKADTEAAQRALVRRVLDRADAREMAARMGLNLEQAASAVGTLSGAELGTAARHASAVESAALAGGSTTVVISLTTLLLILIIVILLVK